MFCIWLVCISGVKCPLPGNVANGRITPSATQMGEYLYRDYIYVRCDTGYKLMKVRQHKALFSMYNTLADMIHWLCCGSQDGRELNSFSTMCQGNGEWHLTLPECHSGLTGAFDSKPREFLFIPHFHWCLSLFLSAVINCGEPKTLLNGGVRQVSGRDNQYQSIVQYYCNEPFYAFFGGVNGEITTFQFSILKACFDHSLLNVPF